MGRNGSGKSSFAEALEVLLTGDLRRWQVLTGAWREGWRNLHAPGQTRLSADLVVEGAGSAVAERTWDSSAGFSESQATVQVHGKKRAGPDRLGWQDALVTYRPFLSHSELEAFFSSPSQLYELLFSVLGLGQLTAADKRLVTARKEREDHLKAVYKDLPALLGRLESAEDERAKSCRQALAARKPDPGRALAVAAGAPSAQPDGEIGSLRQLSQVAAPDQEQVDLVVAALLEAADALARTADSDARRAMDLAGLLRSALQHYRQHGPGACPVCRRAGALDEEWRVRTEAEVTRLEDQSAEAHQARALAADATAKADRLFLPVPGILDAPRVGAADPGPARSAWATFQQHPSNDAADGFRHLAEHIHRTWPALTAAVTALAEQADADLRAREDRWIPVAQEVAAWCLRAQEAETAADAVPALKKAIAWLKYANDDIRNDRLAPLGDHARAIWSRLRQESNVDLGAIRLTGSNTQRKLDVKVTVDGSPGSALGIMSQGEINALALSIFLPAPLSAPARSGSWSSITQSRRWTPLRSRGSLES